MEFRDQILLEQGRRIGTVPEHSCPDCIDILYRQVCVCEAEPDIDEWVCSNCGVGYERLNNG